MKKNSITCAWLIAALIISSGVELVEAQDDENAAVGTSTSQVAPSTTGVADSGINIESGEGLVSVDFKDADIRQVLRVIALKGGVDVVAGRDVEGLVTIKLTNVPWDEALDIILRTYGFTYERQGRVVRVMTIEALEREALSTKVFPLNYAKAEEVPGIINEMLSDRGRIKYDERTNTVIVTDIPSNLFQIKEVIKRIDMRTPQVLISAKIIETKLEEDENLGIDWSDSFTATQTSAELASGFPFPADSTFGGYGDAFLSTPFSKVSDAFLGASALSTGTLSASTLALTLNFLSSRSDTRILSNPSLAVLNNHEATIHIGEEFPIPEFSVDPSTGNTTVSGFETKKVGTTLTVTPHVNPSREIVVDLKPEITKAETNASFVIASGATIELPRFSTQSVTTRVRVKDGETIVIGGLVKETELITITKVPILGDIPFIGALFRSGRKFAGGSNPALRQDLLIFLTVTLMDEDRGTSERTSVAKVME